MPVLGVCGSSHTERRGFVSIASNRPCEDFRVRILPEKEVRKSDPYWCGRCGMYLYNDELDWHRGHELFTGMAMTDPEFNVESTFAGD